jgi:hypothetical protein
MDIRLERCGKSLSTFLEEELSAAHIGLPAGARSHLDRFRTFLQSYYVAKWGYYPPEPVPGTRSTFSKDAYAVMAEEFQALYDYLVDSGFTSADSSPKTAQGGLCVLQNVQAFDAKQHHRTLEHPLPLLPLASDLPQPSTFSRRLSLRSDKMKPDSRLVTLAALTKATNINNQALLDHPLVTAYRCFERECAFERLEKHENVTQTDARKVRWILVYAMHQTLQDVTRVPTEVRDVSNVPYHISVLTAGIPLWKSNTPRISLLRTQTDEAKFNYYASLTDSSASSMHSVAREMPQNHSEIKPDIDYFDITHGSQLSRANTSASSSFYEGEMSSRILHRRGSSVRSARATLGNMPQLQHPRPRKPSHHEILVHGYGNGLNTVSIASDSHNSATEDDGQSSRKNSTDSSSSDVESRINWRGSTWSHSQASSATSISDNYRDSIDTSDKRSLATTSSNPWSLRDFWDADSLTPNGSFQTGDMHSSLQPSPLKVEGKGKGIDVGAEHDIDVEDGFMRVTQEIEVKFDNLADLIASQLRIDDSEVY